MSWGVYELVAQRDAADLRARLELEQCAVRELDGAGLADATSLFARVAQTFRYDFISGWDAFADRMWTALVPEQDEGDNSALLWEHADALLVGDLGSFLTAFDVLVTTSRSAYQRGLDLTIFLLGDGPGFPRLS